MTEVRLFLDEHGTGPLYERVAACLRGAITEGRLAGGDRVPGSRALARQLCVHRNTCLRALSLLEDEGYLEAKGSKGTFVAERLPKVPAQRTGPVSRGPGERHSQRTDLSSQGPDPRLLQGDTRLPLPRAMRSAAPSPLPSSGAAQGALALLLALTKQLAQERGLVVKQSQILITQGSQMALFLLAMWASEQRWDVVVESLGYRRTDEAFEHLRVPLVNVEMDGDGPRVDLMPRSFERPRLLLLTPSRRFPTGQRRRALLDYVQSTASILIEDDFA